MSIQFEDMVDFLTTLHPDFDFIYLFVNSLGHGRRRIGGLESGKVNKQFGGNQISMISSKIVKRRTDISVIIVKLLR